MAVSNKTIFVYADWGTQNPTLIGMLYAGGGRGRELFSFEYDKAWVHNADSGVIFDPDLQLYEGRQYVSADKPLFGVFSDSCPDRWGRLLMKRREVISARKENRKPRALLESDFLLGVFDVTRMGALRFALEKGGPFLAEDNELAVPPWATLRALESASLSFESDESGYEEKWLKQLLAPGSSLGGARPKASVQAPDGSLWIAKFPSKHDEWNSGAWEMVTHQLAVLCGLNVPRAELITLSDKGGTFLVGRFDRIYNRRVHFASAMALLGKSDGSGSFGSSYLDIASFIKSNGAAPKRDLTELFRRIVFNIAVSNTDDHLRNHGFILEKHGWTLSPQYDVNPDIYGDGLSLNISADDNSLSFELAAETAEYYQLKTKDARDTISEIQKKVAGNWYKLAEGYGLSKKAISFMEPAFQCK